MQITFFLLRGDGRGGFPHWHDPLNHLLHRVNPVGLGRHRSDGGLHVFAIAHDFRLLARASKSRRESHFD